MEISAETIPKSEIVPKQIQPPSPAGLIAVQTMWRSCGTYLWSKFRQNPHFCAFDEPLHEKLLSATAESFRAEKNEGVESRLRHPSMARHYFAEYPFLEGGGVPLFHKRFSFERYYMHADEGDPQLQKYLSNLILRAHQQLQRPVAKFCRAGLRTAWMAKVFSPTVIYLLRDPEAMFRSYWSFGGAESYFLFAMTLVVSKNRECPLFAEAAEIFKIPYVEKNSAQEELTEIYRLTRAFDAQQWRDLFLLFWALHLQHNAAYCGLLLDIDLLATEKRYREQTGEAVNELLRTRLSFADARLSATAEAPGKSISSQGLALARNALRNLPEKLDALHLQNMSEGSRRTMEAVL